MKKANTNRIIYSVMTFLVLGLSVFLLSNIIRYFHTGQTVVNKYDVGLSQLLHHDPSTKWLRDDADIKGEINKYIRKDIEEAYLDAWGILNLSIKEQVDLGLKENFTDIKAKQLSNYLKSSHPINREDKNHNLQLHFISYDKQVVSFTDKRMQLETCIVENGIKSLIKDTSDYKVIMTLKDGKWRINKLVRL